MSNTRKLRPPPTGYSYEKLIRVIIGSDLPDEEKEELLIRAAYADKKGRLPDDPAL